MGGQGFRLSRAILLLLGREMVDIVNMSRKTPSNAEFLILLPWWVSASLAGIVYVALSFILPKVESANFVVQAFQDGGAKFAWLPTLVLLLLSCASAFRSRRNRKLLDRQTGLESLREIPWKRFEDLVGEVYRRQGFAVEESLGGGADGGVDLVLRKNGEKILVQCKRWKNKSVGAPVVRELYGLMIAENADAAKLVTTSAFTREASAFATGKPIAMIDGPALLDLVRGVQPPGEGVVKKDEPEMETTGKVLDAASGAMGCPNCEGAMVLRTARRGGNEGQRFWGCSSYPKCRGTRTVDATRLPEGVE